MPDVRSAAAWRVALTQEQDTRADGKRRAGLDHVALRVADSGALRAWQERLSALEVPLSPVGETVRGGLVLSLRDPDGIALELFCRRQPSGDTDWRLGCVACWHAR